MMLPAWDVKRLVLFAMWAVMMTGMMIGAHDSVAGVVRRSDLTRPVVRSYAFAAGRSSSQSVLGGRGGGAATAGERDCPDADDVASSRAASAVLALAGVYQLTPLKRACLSACQSPLTFIARHWQKGLAGAFRMGVAHGVFCVGCCWALMLLLFAGGVMHLTTLGLLTIVVLVEKVMPSESSAQWFTWATGSLLLVLAVWMLI